MPQFHQQSPSKTSTSCFRCNQLGHWAYNCPISPNLRSPISYPSSTSDYPATHCPCGAGFCEIRISNTLKNPDRMYYSCPGKFEYRCEYSKWCDELNEHEIFRVRPKPFPICGCGAGVARIEVEKRGTDSEISYFVCHIKKGYGACDFRQRVDNFSESPLGEDQELDCLTPEDIEILDAAVRRAGVIFLQKNHVQMENRVDGSFDVAHEISSESHSHSFTRKNSENTFVSELAAENDEMLLMMNDCQLENVEASIKTVVATHQNPISQGFNPLNIPEEKLPSEEGALSLDELIPSKPVLKDGLLDALRKLSLCLQKDFITFSDSVGPNNHTFAPLDYLRADYGLFHLQTIEYIKQATAHACIEQAVKDDVTSREAVDRYKKEKAKFEEIFRSFCEALKGYKASNDQLMLVREKISCDRNKLVELEEEELCCEIENAACKENLTQIAKNMSECKDRMQAAYQEVEDALKLSNYSKEGD